MQHICVITIGRSFLIHLSAFWHSRGRICRPTAKFVAPIWTPNCPFGTADRHFVFSRLIFLLFAPGSLSLPPPTRPHSSWGRKSILFPDVGSSFFSAASALLLLFFFSLFFAFVFIPLALCLALARSVCFAAVSLGNIFQYLHVNHEKHVKFVCLVKTSLLRRVPQALEHSNGGRGLPLIGLGNKA